MVLVLVVPLTHWPVYEAETPIAVNHDQGILDSRRSRNKRHPFLSTRQYCGAEKVPSHPGERIATLTGRHSTGTVLQRSADKSACHGFIRGDELSPIPREQRPRRRGPRDYVSLATVFQSSMERRFCCNDPVTVPRGTVKLSSASSKPGIPSGLMRNRPSFLLSLETKGVGGGGWVSKARVS